MLFSVILWVWLNLIKFCHYLTKPIITRIIVNLVLENVIVRTAVLFSEISWLWLNRNKFFHYLTKPIITRIIVSLLFKNVIVSRGVRSKLKLGGSGFQGYLFIKKGHLQVNSFTVAIQRYCLWNCQIVSVCNPCTYSY